MKQRFAPFFVRFVHFVPLVGLLLASPLAWSQPRYSQTLDLVAGWNAVFLEVDPDSSDPAVVFAGLPVDVAAVYNPTAKGAQFVGDPEVNLQGAYGWSVWYAPHRSDAFLSGLHAVYGGRPYLLHCTDPVRWQVEGAWAVERQRWVPNAYNLVGVGVPATGGATFRGYFQGSPAHNHNKIYRLVNGTWRQVLQTDAAAPKPGEAFWIYCDGASDFQGPVDVRAPSHLGLVVSSQSGSELVLRNHSGHPLRLRLECDAPGNQAVPLDVPVMVFDAETQSVRTLQVPMGAQNWTQDLPELAAGAAIRLPFNLRLHDMEPGTRHTMLNVHSDVGTVTRVPVTASRDDLP